MPSAPPTHEDRSRSPPMTYKTLLLRADDSLPALVRQEAVLRSQYLRLAEASSSWPVPGPVVTRGRARILSREEVLELSARVLELLLVVAACNEATVELGIMTLREASPQWSRVIALAADVTGLDPLKVLEENKHFFSRRLLSSVPHDEDRIARDMTVVVHASKATLIGCPIEKLETVAQKLSLEALGHRCRHAYNMLGALVRRNDTSCDGSRKVIGRAYSQGRLTLGEAAEAMALPVVDAVAFLEEHGYARSIEHIRLSDEQRNARYAAIRADRIARRGRRPDDARSLVDRNVIASQRIESVDARRWLPRDES
jgi:hypothetical protein